MRFKIIQSILFYLLGFHIFTQNNVTPPNNTTTPPRNNNINGFESIAWKTTYKDTKEILRTLSTDPENKEPLSIIFDRPNEAIKIKRMGIFYRYVFYKKPIPKFAQEKKELTLPLTEEDAENNEPPLEEGAEFFLLESNFPLIPSKSLQDKLIQKYGNPSIVTTNKNNRGAIIWDKEQGYLIQWVENYKEKPYTRTLYYISKEMREKIMKELNEYQYYRELKAINDILP